MKFTARLALVWLVACHGGDASVHPPAAVSSAAARVPMPSSAPHGGRIEIIAITEHGDAALTADSFSEIRLWPTLDGTHEPVVVHGPSPTQLALGRDREGLFAAILDEAGGVELLRFDASGVLLGRAQLPMGPVILQVVAIPGGVLVRRQDHRIGRFDTRGVATGEIAPAAGQRVVSLAVRSDRVLAGITETGEPRASIARWIMLGSALSWGSTIELPEPLSDLAIAPGGRRIAGIAHDRLVEDEVGQIVELEPQPFVAGTMVLDARHQVTANGRRVKPLEPPTIGFLDDDDAVIGVPGQLKWGSAKGADPWKVGDHDTRSYDGEIAVGDRVVAAHGAALHLLGLANQPEDGRHRDSGVRGGPRRLGDFAVDRFLGYRFLGEGSPATPNRFRNGASVLLEINGGGKLWLDSLLRARTPTLDPDLQDLEFVLDDHHLLFAPLIYEQLHVVKHRIVIRDLTTNTDTKITSSEDTTTMRYDPGTRVLAVAAGENVLRYRLSFDPVAATPLRTLVHTGELRPIYLTDPALANGVVAVVQDALPSHVLVYRIDGDDHGPPVAPQQQVFSGPIAAVDRAGTIYISNRGIRVYHDGHEIESLPIERVSAISHDGTWLAAGSSSEVAVFDVKGVPRWRQPVWKAGSAAWSLDDRTLFVAADGGAAISFDAKTGARLAIRCGWGFGLYEEDVAVSSSTPSACAAP